MGAVGFVFGATRIFTVFFVWDVNLAGGTEHIHQASTWLYQDWRRLVL